MVRINWLFHLYMGDIQVGDLLLMEEILVLKQKLQALFCSVTTGRDIYSVLSFLQDWKKARIQLPRKEKRIPIAAERREDPPRPIRRVCRCRSDRPKQRWAGDIHFKAHSTAEDSTESPTGWMKGVPVPPALPLPKARPLKVLS